MSNQSQEYVVLVDENDRELGTCEKLEAHQKGLLHRAFSVFILNTNNELLLQQRALTKYHSGGLWTNTCCSHPRPGEAVLDAAHRRLKEEMGMECELEKLFSFTYKSAFENGLTEHEYDHVLLGHFENEPVINPDEVAEWKWMPILEVKNDIENNPENYTPWFKIIFEKFYENLLH